MILEKNGRRGGFGFLNILHWVSAKTPHKIVDTAKAHASAVRCVSRQPFFLVIYFLLEFAVREDIKKAGCSVGAKIIEILHTPKLFGIFLMDSWLFFVFVITSPPPSDRSRYIHLSDFFHIPYDLEDCSGHDVLRQNWHLELIQHWC